jgi:hypothetical protein
MKSIGNTLKRSWELPEAGPSSEGNRFIGDQIPCATRIVADSIFLMHYSFEVTAISKELVTIFPCIFT